MTRRSVGSRSPSAALSTLAQRCGVQHRYVDGTGQRRVASTDAVLAVLRAMQIDVAHPEDAFDHLQQRDADHQSRLCEPVTVLWLGSNNSTVRLAPGAADAETVELRITSTDGVELHAWRPRPNTAPAKPHRQEDQPAPQVALPVDLPPGRYQIHAQCLGRTDSGHLFIAPSQCFREEDSTELALFLPLHAVRSDANLGVGTTADLERLGRWAADCGARSFGTLPLLSTFLEDPFEPSPYVPVSRSVFGELFMDFHQAVRDLPLPRLAALLNNTDFAAAARAERARDLVDYRQTWSLVRRCLDAAAHDVHDAPTLTRQVADFASRHPLIADYARFRASKVSENAAPTDTTAAHRAEEQLFLAAQWILQQQLTQAARSLGDRGGLYLDLPIGSHPDGFDVWRHPALYASSASLGAPPDSLFQRGQSWGFPPVIPHVSRSLAHEHFSTAIDAHLTYARALRIDHAAGLFRCFWVPNGFSAADGVYVHQPADELLALLSIHSHHHKATIVAENLGTVPRHISAGLQRRGLRNMSIGQFGLGNEAQPIPTPEPGSLAALNTHDMPTFAAHWRGDDLDLHASLGVVEPQDVPQLREGRTEMRRRVIVAMRTHGWTGDTDPDIPDVLAFLLRAMAESQPAILLINLEDLWQETHPQNVPGIADEYPNWRRKAIRTLRDIVESPSIQAFLKDLTTEPRPAVKE